jgi:hypothetical protein
MNTNYEQPSNPVSSGLALYTEDTAMDVSEMLGQMQPRSDTKLTPFTREFILTVMAICEPLLIQKTINHNELIPLHHALKRLAKKLEFTEGKATATTIRHTYGLMNIALLKMDQGAEVVILESCTGTGEQVVSDLDLGYTKNGIRYNCDYTQAKSDGTHREFIWSKSQQQKKYKSLLRSALDGEVTRVVSFSMDSQFFNLEDVIINQHNTSPREDDFKFADQVVPAVHKLTWEQADEVLQNYASQYIDYNQDRSSMIQTPGFYCDKSAYVSVLSHVSKNGPESARAYEDFRNKMKNSTLASVNQAAHARNFFSMEAYDRISNTKDGTRWCQPLPEVLRGYTEPCPFKRLRLVVKDLDSQGKPVDLLTRMIAHLETNDDVVWSDVQSHTETKYDKIFTNVALKRAYNKQGKMDAYKMILLPNVLKGSTINKLIIEPLRELNPSEHMTETTNLSHLEDQFGDYCDIMSRQGSGSYLIQDVSDMVDDVMTDGPCANMTREIMHRSLRTMKNSTLLSQLAMTQEVTQALLTGARKRRRYGKNVGGLKENSCVFGLTCLSDRAAVVSHNLGPLTFGEFKDVTYFLSGSMRNIKSPLFVKQHIGSMTSPLSMSPAQLDWNITLLHRALSWMSLRYETCMSHFPDKQDDISKEMVMPLSLTFLNSNTFSQVADQLRYFFVNGMGYTSGAGPLFKKIDWYSPKTCLEQLYVMRMYKMSDTLAVAKALNFSDKLVVGSNVHIHEIHDLKMTFKVSGYLVAMPDEFSSYVSQQHTFNSFYNSRALTIQRYQKLVSEALVVKKQLEAREDYLAVKSYDLDHEARNNLVSSGYSVDQLLSLLNDHNYLSSAAQVFSPCPRVVILGFLATTKQFRRQGDKTVRHTVRRIYECDEIHRRLKVSSVMNNRGSVKATKTNGVCVTKVKTDGKKLERVTQNSKCYRTVIDLLNRYMRGELPASAPENLNYSVDEEPLEDDLSQLARLVDLPDNLGPVLAWLTNNFASCVSKMVHKDQLGAREIAVLNAMSRIMCRYVEDVARHIRDVNLANGDRTNLIEVADKRDKVLFEKRRTDAFKRTQNVFYDSADCSTWGPSMMCHDFYLVLKLRFPSPNKTTLLRNSLSLFGTKVFKLPDTIYLDTKANPPPPEESSSSMVNNVKRMMINMREEVGDFSKQLIFLEESMHQGILGCSSSVKGADAHTLSNLVLMHCFKEIELRVITFSTSDDYARIIRWKKGTSGTFKTLKDTLDVHVHILRSAGIKRNLQKSTISKNYFEFNSEFFTSVGEIKPDIKSRLAYIDISTDPDPYPTALRAMNQGVEFLRSEGSLIGASWVFLLNNVLAMYTNQSRRLWKECGRGIYEMPLELGGLVRPDVIKCAISHPLVGLASNYGGDENLERSFSLMADMTPFTSMLTTIEETGDVKLQLPSLSRSGTIHLCQRQRRTTRALEEFLLSADESIYRGLHNSRYTSTLVMSLLACAQRERAITMDQGSAQRFMTTQTPSNVKIFKVNSTLLSAFRGDDKLSRDEMFEVAKTFMLGDKSEYPVQDWPLDFQQMYSDLKVMNDTMINLQPVSMSPVPRIGHTHVRRQRFSNQTYVYDALQAFESQNLPVSLGGTTNLHPWRFLEGKMSYGNFLSKMTIRTQGFRLVLREKDQATRNFVELLLVSNYMAGCRLHYNFNPSERPQRPADSILTTLMPVLESSMSPIRGGIVANLLSPGLRQAMESRRVSKIDITDFVNILTRESDYFIRSQELQQTILGMLMTCGFSENFVVTPNRLALGIPECKFKSSEGVLAWQRNENAEHGLSGREVITYASGVYNHYLWGTRFDLLQPEDSDMDIYYLANVSEDTNMRVKLRSKQGFLMLTDYMSGDPIQVLSQTVIDSKPINVYLKDRLTSDTWLMDRLRVKRQSQFDTAAIIDYYHSAAGLVLDDEEESELDSDEKLVYGDAGLDSDDSDGIDFDLMDLSGLGGILDEVATLPNPPAQEDDSSSEGEQSAPVSSQSSIRQPEGVLVSILSSAVTSVTSQQLLKAERMLGCRLVQGLMITLPLNLGIKRLVDEPGKSAIRQLYESVESMDELDRMWLEDTLDHCLLNVDSIRQWLDTEISPRDSSIQEDDDDGW